MNPYVAALIVAAAFTGLLALVGDADAAFMYALGMLGGWSMRGVVAEYTDS